MIESGLFRILNETSLEKYSYSTIYKKIINYPQEYFKALSELSSNWRQQVLYRAKKNDLSSDNKLLSFLLKVRKK